MPQGERRDIVLRWGGKAGARQEIAFSGTRASLGSKSCRGASAGILCCCGGGGGGHEGRQGIVLSRGIGGSLGLEELPQGERRETVLRRGGCGRRRRHDIVLGGGKGSSGPKSCRGASAGMLLCVGEERRGRQENVLGGRRGSAGSKSCRRAGAGRLFCVWGRRRRQEIVLRGRRGSSGLKKCRRASAGRLLCVGGGRRGGGGRKLF